MNKAERNKRVILKEQLVEIKEVSDLLKKVNLHSEIDDFYKMLRAKS